MRGSKALAPVLPVAGLLLALLCGAMSTEITIKIDGFRSSCFFEEVAVGDALSLEYQVIQGGRLDIDLVVLDPANQRLFEERRRELDAKVAGEYSFCFANEYSSDTKLVYVDVSDSVKEEQQMEEVLRHGTGVLTQLETASSNIRTWLATVIDFQRHHRAESTKHIYLAAVLNQRVVVWAVVESFIVICVCVGQVFILKSWFQKPEQISRDARVLMIALIVVVLIINVPVFIALVSGDDDLNEGVLHKAWEVLAGSVTRHDASGSSLFRAYKFVHHDGHPQEPDDPPDVDQLIQ